MFKPQHSLVLLRPDPVGGLTAGGIVLPDSITPGTIRFGNVVRVGPGRQLEDGDRELIPLRPGDRVAWLAGLDRMKNDAHCLPFSEEGIEYGVVNYSDIIGVIGTTMPAECLN